MDWNKLKDEITSGQSGLYFKPEEGENKIRLVSEPLCVWKAFDKTTNTATTYLTQEEAKKNKNAKSRHVMWIINRKNNECQIAEFGAMIMEKLVLLATSKQYGFKDMPPYDMTLVKTGSGMETSYDLLADRHDTELTPDETEKIKGLKPVIEMVIEDAVDADAYRSSIIPF